MSLTGALFLGRLGAQRAEPIIGDDRRQTSPTRTPLGYKDHVRDVRGHGDGVEFSDVPIPPAGVGVNGRTNVTQQGLLAPSTNPTDVAIKGAGFFRGEGPQRQYLL